MDTSNNMEGFSHEKEITLADLLLDIWRSRVFIIIFYITSVSLVLSIVISRYPLHYDTICMVTLNFAGIEKKEYPDGTPFNKMDIIAPDILSQALDSVEHDGFTMANLRDMVTIQAIVPPEIKDKDLEKKAEDSGYIFQPNLFRIIFRTNYQKQISTHDKEKILYKIVEGYRRQVCQRYYTDNIKLILMPDITENSRDISEILTIIKYNVANLLDYLNVKITNASNFISQKNKLSFQDIRKRILLLKDIELRHIIELNNYNYIGDNKNKKILHFRQRISELERQFEIGQKQGKMVEDLLKTVLNVKPSKDIADLSISKNSADNDKKHTEKLEGTQNIQMLINKTLEIKNNALVVESEVLENKENLKRLLSNDYTDNPSDAEVLIKNICDDIRTMISLTEDVSNEYGQYLSAKSINIIKDPVAKECRDVNFLKVIATISCISLLTAVSISLLTQYIRRIRINNAVHL